MASFKFEICSNIQVYGSVEVEADSFQEAAQRFWKLPDLEEVEWGQSSCDYVVDRIICSDYKLSPDSDELDKEV